MILNSGCHAVVLSQQQQTLHYCNQVKNTPDACCKTVSKTCTVVENGRVVVKPISEEGEPRELSE